MKFTPERLFSVKGKEARHQARPSGVPESANAGRCRDPSQAAPSRPGPPAFRKALGVYEGCFLPGAHGDPSGCSGSSSFGAPDGRARRSPQLPTQSFVRLCFPMSTFICLIPFTEGRHWPGSRERHSLFLGDLWKCLNTPVHQLILWCSQPEAAPTQKTNKKIILNIQLS